MTISELLLENKIFNFLDATKEPKIAVKKAPKQSVDHAAKVDFLGEAKKLVDAGEAKSMTEAMRTVSRQRPELHEAFKSNQKFRDLVQRHSLAIEQAKRARNAGYSKVADGTLAVAEEICRKIRQLLRKDKYRALLAERSQVAEKLHKAIIGGGDAERLGEQLAGIDRQFEVL